MNPVVIAETVRRHVTHIGYIAFLGLLILVAAGVSVFNRPGTGWPSLVALLAMITGCGVIGPEFSKGTLQLILVKPVNRAVYLVSRVTGVVLAVWLAAIVAALCELAARALWGEGGLRAETIGTALLNAAADTILIVATLALLGSLTRAYLNIAIYVVAMVGLNVAQIVLGLLRQTQNFIGAFLRRNTALDRAIMAVDRNVFTDFPPWFDQAWLLMVLSNAAIALLLACLAFRRREVPYGAD